MRADLLTTVASADCVVFGGNKSEAGSIAVDSVVNDMDKMP